MPVTRSSSNRQKNSASYSSSRSIANTLNNSNKKRKTPKKTSPMASSAATSGTTTTDTIFFWAAEEQPYGVFCQWYISPITGPLLTFDSPDSSTPTTTHPATPPGPVTFNCGEQFMMAHKALLFNPDNPTYLLQILASSSPREQKSLGRKLPNFDEDLWKTHRMNIVTQANYLKFTQDERLKKLLLDTGDREIVEASPRDPIWGVGFGARNAEKNRERWGLNLLGVALMAVRERIRKEERERIEGKEE